MRRIQHSTINTYIPPFDYNVGQLYASFSHYMHEITNFVPSWKSNKIQRLHLDIFAIQMSFSLGGRNHELHLQNNMSSDKV